MDDKTIQFVYSDVDRDAVGKIYDWIEKAKNFEADNERLQADNKTLKENSAGWMRKAYEYEAEVERLKEKHKEAYCLLSDVKHYRDLGVRNCSVEWGERLDKFLEVKS